MDVPNRNNRIARALTALLLMAVVSAFGSPVRNAIAASPLDTISYQGRLLGTNGVPVADASLEFVFRLFDSAAAGTCLWESDDGTACDGADETQTVALTDGLFSENIGSAIDPAGLSEAYPATLAGVFEDNATVYLEVVVAGETLSPRKLISAAPYALNAQSLDGMDSTELLAAAGDTATGIFDFTGAFFSGASPLAFEGATADDFETLFSLTDPDADRTITFQNASGTVAFTSDIPAGSTLWESGASSTFEDDDDVVVGTSGAETIAAAGFGLTGDDLFATGDIAAEGTLYADTAINVVGSVLDINSLDFVGAGTLSTGATTALTLNSGTTGTIAIGDDASAETVNVATGAAAKTLTVGSTNTTSATTVQSGTGDLALTSSDDFTLTVTDTIDIDSVMFDVDGATGSVAIDDPGDIGSLTINGSILDFDSLGFTVNATISTGANSLLALESGTTGTIQIGNDASAEIVQIATGAAAKVLTIGSTNTTAGTTVQSGTGDVTVTSTDDFFLTITDAIAIDGAEFDVSGTTGSITINDAGDAGAVTVEGTALDINSLDFAAAGTFTTTGAGTDLTLSPIDQIILNGGSTIDAQDQIVNSGGEVIVNDNLLVGGAAVAGVKADFVLSGDDLFVAGDIGIQSNAYADSFVAGDASTTYADGSVSTTSQNFLTNISVSGVDAALHTLSLQIDGNVGVSVAATGDGAGGVGARTVNVGVSGAADTVAIGDANADVALTDANWSISSIGGASFASLSLSGTFDMLDNPIVNIGDNGTDFNGDGGLTLAGALVANGTATFNGAVTFNTDADLALAGTENLTVTGTSGDSAASLVDIRLSNTDTTLAAQRALYLVNTSDAAVSITESLLEIDNLDGDILSNGILVTATTEITDAIDASAADITNALNVGANVILGSGATIDFSEFDVAAGTGSVTINDGGDLGTLTVEGTSLSIDTIDFVGAGIITSSGGGTLTINSDGGGAISLGTDGSAETISIGTGAAGKTLTLGSTNSTSATTIQSGTGDITLTSGEDLFVTATAISVNGAEFDIDSTNGGVTINDTNAANAGFLLVENTRLDINEITIQGTGGMGTFATSAGTIMSIESGTGGSINLGNDASGENINLGTGAAAKVVTLGSQNTTSSTTVQSGTGDIQLTSLDRINLDATGDFDLAAGGSLSLEGSGGVTNIATGNVDFDVNIATSGIRNVTLGSNVGASTLSLIAGSGLINIGSDADTGQIDILTGDTFGDTIQIGNNNGGTVMELHTSTWDINTNGNASFGQVGITHSGSEALRVTIADVDSPAANSVGTQALVLDTDEDFGAADGVQSDAMMLVREDAAGTPDTVFRIDADGDLWADGTLGAGAADVAEVYPSVDVLVPGELVSMSPSGTGVVRSTGAYQSTLMGAVSTMPGLLLAHEDPGYRIALTGRVPAFVSAENGSIAPGDPITSSSVPGVGMKATHPGMIAGFALEAYSGTGTGSVSLFVSPQFYMGSVVGTDGALTSIQDDVELTGSLTVRGASGASMTLATESDGGDDYKLSVRNAAGSQVAYVSQDGDLALAGRLFPSDRGSVQTSKYIYYDGSAGGAGDFMRTNAAGWATGSYDFAEMFPSSDALEPGDVVTFGSARESVAQSTEPESRTLAGIVSTRPGFLAGENAPGQYPIALAGRVPTKVSAENGAIAIGDALTSSSRPGYAMRATEPGPIVGFALEPYDGGADDRIVVFVNATHWDGGDSGSLPGTTDVASGIGGSGANFSSLNMGGSIYMGGNDILEVRRIAGMSDRWSIEEDGTVRTSGLLTTVTESYQGEDVVTAALTSSEVLVTISGTATLESGRATVRFEDVDPSFNDITSIAAPLRVIATPNGPVSLYVSDKDNDGFVIRQIGGSDSGVEIDWMAMAYRKGYEPEADVAVEEVVEVEVIEAVEVVDEVGEDLEPTEEEMAVEDVPEPEPVATEETAPPASPDPIPDDSMESTPVVEPAPQAP